jgi:cbb3-type cytochrome oxidase subunit 3
MNDDSLTIASPAEFFRSNPAVVIFTVLFALIFVGTVYFYLTIRQRQRMPNRRKSFQAVHDAIDYSKRVKYFFQLVAEEKAGKPKPIPPYKPLVGGLPPRRDEPVVNGAAEGKTEIPKP